MFSIQLTKEQLDVVLAALDKAAVGVQASAVVIPVFEAIASQVKGVLEEQAKESTGKGSSTSGERAVKKAKRTNADAAD